MLERIYYFIINVRYLKKWNLPVSQTTQTHPPHIYPQQSQLVQVDVIHRMLLWKLRPQGITGQNDLLSLIKNDQAYTMLREILQEALEFLSLAFGEFEQLIIAAARMLLSHLTHLGSKQNRLFNQNLLLQNMAERKPTKAIKHE